MPRYEVEYIKDAKKQTKWFETREEAEDFLAMKECIAFYNKMPKNGSIELRADFIRKNVTDLYLKLNDIKGSEEILEWVRPKD